MNHQQLRLEIYGEQRQLLKTYIEKKWDNFDLKNYHFMSANLGKCLPGIAAEQHKQVYHDILSYRALQSIDTRFYQHFDNIDDFKDFNYEKIKEQLPAVFVSFHLGSFRSALAFLIRYNLDVVLIIDPLPYRLQKDAIISQYEVMKQAFGSASDLVIYPADQKDLSIQLLDKTRKQYSVLAFIDGNTGFNGTFNQKKSEKIPFLGQEIAMRKGLAMLSFYSRRPIVPMLSFYDDRLQPRWKIFDPIVPAAGATADEFAKDCLHTLFGILENALKEYYAQWEGWLYLHKFLDTSSFGNTGLTKEGPQAFVNPHAGLFAYEQHYYVLNKENYHILEISEEVFSTLSQGNIDKDTINPEERSMLFSNGILKNRIHHASN
jgi:lauroyl/myristoyl acyltransferase